ncbi:MAG: universal stress protein [Thermoplasmata archaeon]
MKFLLAFDGSSGSVAAAEFLKKILKEGDDVTGLYIINNIEVPFKVELFEGTRNFETVESFIFYLRDLFKAIFEGKNFKFAYKIEQKENISKIILNFAIENGFEMIVTGTRKLKGLEKLILGSVSQGLITESTIPVLVVPP